MLVLSKTIFKAYDSCGIVGRMLDGHHRQADRSIFGTALRDKGSQVAVIGHDGCISGLVIKVCRIMNSFEMNKHSQSM